MSLAVRAAVARAENLAPAAQPARTAVSTNALRKTFGEFEAVKGVSFSVPEGGNFGLLGPNGAGKSTLIRMLTTLMRPTSGTATVSGHDIVKDAGGVRRSIGVVPQAATSDPDLTAEENLEFYAGLYRVPRSEARESIRELLTSVDLWKWRDKKVGTFSGGMRRRVEVARSLVHRPRILFLDEPTTGLDPASRIAMWEMLRTIKQHRRLTIVLTTHYMQEADELCEQIGIFDHGRMVAMGTPAQLKALLPPNRSLQATFNNVPQFWVNVLRSLPGVTAVENQSGTYFIETTDAQQSAEALLRTAQERRVAVTSIATRGNSLEDVFVHFTGRDLRDAEGSYKTDVRHLYEKRRD
jgi:ABC-2 type transport system ATP-binding protein